jgi:hypothetical protein
VLPELACGTARPYPQNLGLRDWHAVAEAMTGSKEMKSLGDLNWDSSQQEMLTLGLFHLF